MTMSSASPEGTKNNNEKLGSSEESPHPNASFILYYLHIINMRNKMPQNFNQFDTMTGCLTQLTIRGLWFFARHADNKMVRTDGVWGRNK
jgi:hypothetical protein